MRFIGSLFLFISLLFAGCLSDDTASKDSRDSVVFRDGDATGYTACETTAILSFVNAPSSTVDVLKVAGVHTVAARNIVEYRDGSDGISGTQDDQVIDTLIALDEIPYVGPVAMEALELIGKSECDGSSQLTGEACILAETLYVVNHARMTASGYRSLGLTSRGADNLVSTRDGADGVSGTADDIPFLSLQQIDDVPQVGEASLRHLRTHGERVCLGGGQALFSPQDYDDSHLQRVAAQIEAATVSIDVAMYSFRDSRILDALEGAVNRGVSVRMLFQTASEDRKAPDGTWSAALEDAGIEVRWINKIMHHKFAIIDGPLFNAHAARDGILINGSGNWSYSAATRYDENTVFVDDDERLLLLFQREFNWLWENSRPVEWNEDIVSATGLAISDTMVESAEGSDAVFTSDNFNVYESSTYGATFSVDKESHAASDALVELIASAKHSISIASGHMRSRGIAEALIAARAANPSLDIRVYLDGQEYVSYWTHSDQLDEYEDCMNDAGSSESAQRACYDKGYYFAYALDLTGLDVRYKYYAYRWDYSYAAQMHHKFILVDEAILASGSYNFSNNAEQNTMENVVFYSVDQYPTLVAQFRHHFDGLWVTGEADDLYFELMDDIENGTDDSFPIVFDAMALNWSQVTDLKSLIRSKCADINSSEFRENPAMHWRCDR